MLIFTNELRQGRRALIAWSISVAAYAAFFISFFGKMDMADMIKSIPEGMRTAFDMDVLDLGTVLGFWAMEGHIMTLLGGGIFATLIAAAMLAKEESDRTISFLYSKPLTRAQIVTGKLMAIFANVAIFDFHSPSGPAARDSLSGKGRVRRRHHLVACTRKSPCPYLIGIPWARSFIRNVKDEKCASAGPCTSYGIVCN